MARGQSSRRAANGRQAQLTHFLCIPLITETSRPKLDATFDIFRKDVAADVPRQAIRPVGTLHLTLGVMSLTSAQLSAATTLLQQLDISKLLLRGNAAPLKLLLRGLEPMQEPDNTSILYIEPQDASGRLRDFCLVLKATFEEQGLLVSDDRPLRLHATVVNTIYAKGLMPRRIVPKQESLDGATGPGSKAKGSAKIDARETLKKYKDYTWADDVVIDRIAICEMGAKKEYDDEGRLVDEHYKEVAQIMLPI